MSVITAPAETKLITGEELFAMGEIGPCELVEGRIVWMAPAQDVHGVVEFDLGWHLRSFDVDLVWDRSRLDFCVL